MQVSANWAPVFPVCDLFLRRLWNLTGNSIKTGSEKESGAGKIRSEGGSGEGSIQLGSQMGPLFDILCCVLRMPGVGTHRTLLVNLLTFYLVQTSGLKLFLHFRMISFLCIFTALVKTEKKLSFPCLNGATGCPECLTLLSFCQGRYGQAGEPRTSELQLPHLPTGE